jgi:hypothetical protein
MVIVVSAEFGLGVILQLGGPFSDQSVSGGVAPQLGHFVDRV